MSRHSIIGNNKSALRSETKSMIGPGMSFAAAEAYKLLRTNLMFSLSGDAECSVIGVTSSFREEGKSITSINLAYTLALTQKKVLLIEGDMRLPTIGTRLELAHAPGLSNLLAGMNVVSQAVQRYEAETEDKKVVVDVMVAGDTPPNPSELLGSERMMQLVTQLKEFYHYIIVDLPPVTAVSDPIVACRLVDGMIVIVRSDHSVRDAVKETVRQMKQIDAHILGFVFNGAGEGGGGYYKGKRYYRKHYYYKKYYKSYQKEDSERK